eukprot:TRINITY_DN26230_c0_g1_i1.p1 TRINITY_DN26230_c0_g1~~TRINITY_DN26230_c0_g1_i1.p1  ORF type:complete len:470 (+),score=94.73 TRINITY_DN26230_c0_g1_i1:88-1497(+)
MTQESLEMEPHAVSKHSLRLMQKLCARKLRPVKVAQNAFAGLQVRIVSNTVLYQHLAKTHVFDHDRAVEIGSSYGHCTGAFCCPALGVDVSMETVEQARQAYPRCRFVCADIFGSDLSFLDLDATTLFVDIGGNRNYKPVMKVLAICLPLMPALRLVVIKSIEARSFLLRAEYAAQTVARDISVSKDDDQEAAEELAMEVRRHGGEYPVHLLNYLHCGRRLRFLVGKRRIAAFLKKQEPLLSLVEVETGPTELRRRIRCQPSSEGEVALPPHSALGDVRAMLTKKLRQQLNDGREHLVVQIFKYVRVATFRKYLAVASDPELYRQASDSRLGGKAVEAWSDEWQSMVAMRHLYAFFVQSPEFAVTSDDNNGEPLTMDQLCQSRVRYVGEPAPVEEIPDEADGNAVDGRRIMLQVLDSNWRTGENDKPEVQDLIVERAWLLAGADVVEELQCSVVDAACDSVPVTDVAPG